MKYPGRFQPLLFELNWSNLHPFQPVLIKTPFRISLGAALPALGKPSLPLLFSFHYISPCYAQQYTFRSRTLVGGFSGCSTEHPAHPAVQCSCPQSFTPPSQCMAVEMTSQTVVFLLDKNRTVEEFSGGKDRHKLSYIMTCGRQTYLRIFCLPYDITANTATHC